MNERIYNWNLSEDAFNQLVNLDKEDRREFFLNFPLQNVPMGALMGFSKISIDFSVKDDVFGNRDFVIINL